MPTSPTLIIKTRPQTERRAADTLAERGISTEVWHEMRVIRSRTGGRRRIERPLMPGYIGAQATPAEVMAAAHAAEDVHLRRDVTGVVGVAHDGALTYVRAEHGREVDPYGLLPRRSEKPAVGDLVTLRSGPFQGWNVRVRALHGRAFSADCAGYPVRLPYEHLHPG